MKIRSLLLILSTLTAAPGLRANDGIFPPAPAAADTINFDGKGFLIHGQRVFLASGSIHYARVPRELWRDRLLKLKRAGFNTVQTYVLWNFHEAQKGQIDFSTGARDLAAFLQTAQDVGLYATVRVGPYDCAEWDSGGYPVWLRFVPGLKVRMDNAPFLEAVDAFWDKLLPIVAAHQIHRGGNVVLVQLENEHPDGWGTDMPNAYFTHLQKKALDLGIEVPYFFSGLHHDTDPAGHLPWDSAGRKNPWYSTETWIRWYDAYGNSDPNALAGYTRNIWNIVANGGNGFNLYMFHGGTNFDFFNNDEDAASYDYGTLVGEAGDLRNLYYSVRRAGTFATSFPDILANSTDATGAYAHFLDATGGADPAGGATPQGNAAIHPYARTSPAGTIVFLRNTTHDPQTAAIPAGGTLNLDPLEVAPVLVDTTLAPGIRAKLAAARTLGLATNGTTTTWIVYGKPEDKGHLELELDQPAILTADGKTGFDIQSKDPMHHAIDITFPDAAPQQLVLTAGGHMLRILAETVPWTDRTWIAGEPGAQEVVTGPGYVGDFAEAGGKAQFTAARAFGTPALKDVAIYGAAPQPRAVSVTDPAPDDADTAPALDAWQVAPVIAPADPNFTDTGWLAADQPPQLGADGDPTAYGWYRASFDAPIGGAARLATEFGDDAVVFLNGKLAGHTEHKDGLSLDVAPGRNNLAIFVGFQGRQKAFNYVGQPLLTYFPKGIVSPVTLTVGDQKIAVTGWKMRGGIGAPDDPSLSWEPAPSGGLGTPAFFRTQFDAKPSGAAGPNPIYRLSTSGLSRGSVWLNGHNLGRYPQTLKVDGLYLPECWLVDGHNSLVVFDEEGRVPSSSVHLWCERVASRELIPVRE